MNAMGRKKKKGHRHPGGKLVQPPPAEHLETVVRARMHQFGLSKESAKEKFGGTAIGRANQRWRQGDHATGIKDSQFKALEAFAEARAELDKALSIPKQRSASNFEFAGGYDSSEGNEPGYVDYCRKTQQKYAAMVYSIIQHAGRDYLKAAEIWAIQDKSEWNLIGDLRLAANALIRIMPWTKTKEDNVIQMDRK